jgi:hypothetical protein
MTTVTDQLASGHVPWLYLAELSFASGPVRLCTWSHAIDWMGHTWQGLATAVEVSAVKAGEQLAYPALDIALNIGSDAILAIARGSAAAYRGRPITLYLGVLDDALRPLGDPEIAWAGVMSQIRLSTGDGERDRGSVVMRCEQQGRDNRAATSLRLNDAQHQARWPGDTFLTRMEALTGQPVPWLTKRFQQQ